MKQVFGNVCRASVAAAGVMVAASAASAETGPVQFETEFDLDLAGGAITAGAVNAGAPTVSAITLDIASAAAKWEESIGAYLEGLLAADAATGAAPAAEEAKAHDPVTEAVIEEEIEAFAQPETVEAKPAVTQEAQALPPALKVALGYDIADAVLELPKAVPAAAQEKAPQPQPATPQPVAALAPQLLAPVLSTPMGCESCAAHRAQQARIDDAAAWQKLAEWASSRAEEDAGSADDTEEAVAADGDFLFDFFDGDDESPTE